MGNRKYKILNCGNHHAIRAYTGINDRYVPEMNFYGIKFLYN